MKEILAEWGNTIIFLIPIFFYIVIFDSSETNQILKYQYNSNKSNIIIRKKITASARFPLKLSTVANLSHIWSRADASSAAFVFFFRLNSLLELYSMGYFIMINKFSLQYLFVFISLIFFFEIYIYFFLFLLGIITFFKFHFFTFFQLK